MTDPKSPESPEDGPQATAPQGVWHPPRGPLTRIVAWAVIAIFGLCVLLMIAAIVLA